MEPKHDCNCFWLNVTVGNRMCVGFFWVLFLFIFLNWISCSSSIFRHVWSGRHRTWVTGNSSHMSLPHFKALSTTAIQGSSLQAKCKPTVTPPIGLYVLCTVNAPRQTLWPTTSSALYYTTPQLTGFLYVIAKYFYPGQCKPESGLKT